MNLFQYQALAEPLFTTFLDWYSQQPDRLKQHPPVQVGFYVEPLEPTLLDPPTAWWQPLQTPNNPKRKLPPTEFSMPWEPTLFMEMFLLPWWQPISEPTRPLARMGGTFFVEPFEPSLTEAPPPLSWEPHVSQPSPRAAPKFMARTQLTGSFSASQFVTPVVFNPATFSQPQPLPLIPRPFYLSGDRVVQPIIEAIVEPEGVRPKFKFSHEVKDIDPRVRKAIQQMSTYFNNMFDSGELGGPITDPYLGYKPGNIQHWSTVEPATLKEAIDRIAAALAALGQQP